MPKNKRTFLLRLSPELFVEISRRAKAEHRSMNAQVAWMLETLCDLKLPAVLIDGRVLDIVTDENGIPTDDPRY